MRTRAQHTRDAALQRLTRVNHSLAVAAVVGAGVVTDLVANTPKGHARTIATTGATGGSGQVTLLTSPQSSPTRRPRAVPHRASTHHTAPARQPAAQQPAAQQPAAKQPAPRQPVAQQPAAPQPAAPQPTVVVVSGGS